MESTYSARRKAEEIAYFVDHNITRMANKIAGQKQYDNAEWEREQATKRGHRYSKSAHERT